MPNFETAGTHGLFQFGFSVLADMRAQFALHNAIEKSVHLALLTINLQLNPSIRQVSDPSGNVESFGDVPDGPAEADALNVALVKYLDGNHAEIAWR